MEKKCIFIMPNEDGGWAIKKSNTKYASVRTETKAEAVKIGRVISQCSYSELVILGENAK